MSLQDKFDSKETTMANGKTGLFRRLWDGLMAMDYSSLDYSMDRIRGLERDVAQLKDELKHARAPSDTPSAEIRTKRVNP
jgi:hypothetical protein